MVNRGIKPAWDVYCPNGHRLRARPKHVGAEKQCPRCKKRFIVKRPQPIPDVEESRSDASGSTDESEKPELDPFHLDRPVFQLGEDNPVCWRDLQRGLLAVGSTGSGKTSSVMKLVVLSSLRLGAGGIFFTTKRTDRAEYEAMARLASRQDDVVVIDQDREVFNWLDWESRHRQGSFSNNVVELLYSLIKLADGTDQNGGEAYWRFALKELIRNTIELLMLSGEVTSLVNLHRVVASVAQTPEQIHDSEWQSTSYCNSLLNRCAQQGLNHSDDEDFEQIGRFFLCLMPDLHPKTRSIVVSSLTGLIDIFLRGKFRRLFSSGESSVTPEQCWADRKNLLIVDLPIDVHQESGRLAQLLIKRCFQRAIQSRECDDHAKPVIALMDEAQYLIDSDADQLYTSNCRSKAVVNFWLTQSIDAVFAACGGGPKGEQIANAILANLSNKVFLQQSGNSADWASRLFGQEYRYLDYGGGSIAPSFSGGGHGGASKQLQPRLLPSAFYDLKTGGEPNDLLVEGYVWKGGANFSNGKPYLKVAFDQRFAKGDNA